MGTVASLSLSFEVSPPSCHPCGGGQKKGWKERQWGRVSSGIPLHASSHWSLSPAGPSFNILVLLSPYLSWHTGPSALFIMCTAGLVPPPVALLSSQNTRMCHHVMHSTDCSSSNYLLNGWCVGMRACRLDLTLRLLMWHVSYSSQSNSSGINPPHRYPPSQSNPALCSNQHPYPIFNDSPCSQGWWLWLYWVARSHECKTAKSVQSSWAIAIKTHSQTILSACVMSGHMKNQKTFTCNIFKWVSPSPDTTASIIVTCWLCIAFYH